MFFPSIQEILDIHRRLIKQFGRIDGVRDYGVLESALVAAENRAYYENASLAICAATYAYHLTQAHAFLDGNKRLAAAVSEIFLEMNGASLQATNEQIVVLFLEIAAGEIERNEVEHFFSQWTEYR
jgi:death-on-curing protein